MSPETMRPGLVKRLRPPSRRAGHRLPVQYSGREAACQDSTNTDSGTQPWTWRRSRPSLLGGATPEGPADSHHRLPHAARPAKGLDRVREPVVILRGRAPEHQT